MEGSLGTKFKQGFVEDEEESMVVVDGVVIMTLCRCRCWVNKTYMLAHAIRITRHAESFIVTDVSAGGSFCVGTDISAGDLDAVLSGGGAGNSCSIKRRCLAGQRKLAARGLLILLLLLLEVLRLFF